MAIRGTSGRISPSGTILAVGRIARRCEGTADARVARVFGIVSYLTFGTPRALAGALNTIVVIGARNTWLGTACIECVAWTLVALFSSVGVAAGTRWAHNASRFTQVCTGRTAGLFAIKRAEFRSSANIFLALAYAITAAFGSRYSKWGSGSIFAAVRDDNVVISHAQV